MKPNFPYLLLILLTILISSCQSPTRRWLDSMANYREIQSSTLKLQILRIKNADDTSSLTYRVRITLSAKNSAVGHDNLDLYYRMDSCFSLKSGNSTFPPAIVQAVPNGIKGCFEYLLSFDISQAMKLKTTQLLYQDRYIDGKSYALLLNQH